MATPEHSREPCPDRILDDVGGAFGMGAVGGSVFHFFKGVYNLPKGGRLIGGTQATRMNASRVGGSFAVWGALFSTFDCTSVYVRQKEDPWNSIIAGAAAGGFLQLRHGFASASRSAAFGGLFLALIEGGAIMLNKFMNAQEKMLEMEEQLPNMAGAPGFPIGQLPDQAPLDVERLRTESSASSSSASFSSSSPSSWLGGIFGGREKVKAGTSSGSKTTILESFDAPIPPAFEYK